jgi:zinc transport system ATP-binding protein
MNPVIQVQNVSFSYGGPAVLKNVNLELEKGEFLGLVGPNGGGKSTLLKVVLGLIKPSAGRVIVFGKSPEKGRADIGYVPQWASFQREFPISVQQTVLLGRLGRTRAAGGYTKQDKAIVLKVMEKAHILELRHRSIGDLSGGQLQRVLVARALACEPEILLLDEPTANIDQRGEEDIFDWFRELNARLTILLVSHDIGFISRHVQRVACLNQTLICHRTEAISGEIIQNLYGTPMHLIQHNRGRKVR